jgi:ABC-type microcin C transport system duplicated ATPase subunit YejF
MEGTPHENGQLIGACHFPRPLHCRFYYPHEISEAQRIRHRVARVLLTRELMAPMDVPLTLSS